MRGRGSQRSNDEILRGGTYGGGIPGALGPAPPSSPSRVASVDTLRLQRSSRCPLGGPRHPPPLPVATQTPKLRPRSILYFPG